MKDLKLLVASFCLAVTAVNAQEVRINATELPQETTKFLQQHFTTSTVQYAEVESGFSKKSYEVKLADGTEIDFDSNGAWREIDGKSKAVPNSIIPQKIADYVNANYMQQQIVKIEKNRTTVDVELGNDIELEFDSKGNFLRVDR